MLSAGFRSYGKRLILEILTARDAKALCIIVVYFLHGLAPTHLGRSLSRERRAGRGREGAEGEMGGGREGIVLGELIPLMITNKRSTGCHNSLTLGRWF